MSRRAHRAAGPVTPATDQLVGTWTRADDASSAVPPVRSGPAAGAEADEQPAGRTRRSRRVTTRPVPGSDPSPAPEPARHRDGENDAQLLRDVPPHW